MIFDDSLDLYQAVGPVPVGVVMPEVLFVDEKPPEVGTNLVANVGVSPPVGGSAAGDATGN